jgi:hypothetical protein
MEVRSCQNAGALDAVSQENRKMNMNDRILLRDRPWVVRQVTQVEGSRLLLKLEALDGDEPASLEVAVPPEEPQALPTEDLRFDLAQLDSLTPGPTPTGFWQPRSFGMRG